MDEKTHGRWENDQTMLPVLRFLRHPSPKLQEGGFVRSVAFRVGDEDEEKGGDEPSEGERDKLGRRGVGADAMEEVFHGGCAQRLCADVEMTADEGERLSVLHRVEGPCTTGQCGLEAGSVIFKGLDEGVLADVASEAESEPVCGGGHVEFEIPIGKRVVEGNCLPSLAGPEMAGAEHRDGGWRVVGEGLVGEPVRVCGVVAAVEFIPEEVGIFGVQEIDQAGGEVRNEGEVVVFVEENVGVREVT